MNKPQFFSLFLFFIGIYTALSQSTQNAITIDRTDEIIQLDGQLTEKVWQSADWAGGFVQFFPTDSLPAQDLTEFALTFDDKNLYVAIIAYQSPSEKKPVAVNLRRDFEYQPNENVAIYIDSYGDKSNGFSFQVTPYNVQREGVVILLGEVATDWDNKWYSATTLLEDRWVVEMSIPFTSFRYNVTPEWGIQVLRNNLRTNERTSWVRVPLQYRASDLLYTGSLIWRSEPPSAGRNISLIPFSTLRTSQDVEENKKNTRINGGFDAKLGLSNALNLDLTVNPDFSQVEVDRQVTNLNRFELFFPERRQFFLENQDLFSTNGFPVARPFFSRRIGIAQDENGLAREIPILGGMRLSGKIGRDWRIGGLSMQTAQDEKTNSPAQNYSMAIAQRQINGRSNISALLINRQSVAYDKSDTTGSVDKYNRVYGLDYNLISQNNKWEGNFFYHRSLEANQPTGTFATGAFLQYRVRTFTLRYFHTSIGNDYRADVGFVPRNGVFTAGGGGELNFYPSSSLIQRHGIDVSFSQVNTLSLNRLDQESNISYRFNFLNTAYAEIGTDYSSIFLQDPFDPTNTDGPELEANERYSWWFGYLVLRSDRRRLTSGFLNLGTGGYFNGQRTRIRGSIDYRFQPYVLFSLAAEYNRIDLPSPFKSTDFYLIGPRLDLTFTTKLFFTTFAQYNTQIDNFNVNTRLQWRFRPVSDLFIVYTDNYDTGNFTTKNRAIVGKITYWFNL